MRWKMRSPPERSTRTAMPGSFASKALAMRSATGRSTAVYQTALPSFLAASMSWGVTAEADTVARAARGTEVAASAVASPRENARRLIALAMIDSSQIRLHSVDQCVATVCRQKQAHPRARREVGLGRSRNAQRHTTADFDNIVAAGTKKDVAE